MEGDIAVLDLIYVVATVAFFVLVAVIGRGLERIGTDIPPHTTDSREPGNSRTTLLPTDSERAHR